VCGVAYERISWLGFRFSFVNSEGRLRFLNAGLGVSLLLETAWHHSTNRKRENILKLLKITCQGRLFTVTDCLLVIALGHDINDALFVLHCNVGLLYWFCIRFLGVVGADVSVAQIQQMLDTALPAGCVSLVVHSLDGATVSHPLLAHLLVHDEVQFVFLMNFCSE